MIQVPFSSPPPRPQWRVDLSAWILDHSVAPQPPPQLTGTEQARLEKLIDPVKRTNLERSYRTVRAGLSEHLGCQSADIIIEHDDLGAPFLSSYPDLCLSISRTEGWSAFALSPDAAIGIDIERVRSIDWHQMVSMVCAPSESSLLSQLEDGVALLPFYRIWTAKEAIMKAAGQGFRMGAPRIGLPEDFILGETVHAEVQAAGHAFTISCSLHGEIMVGLALETG
ncbi:MAG: 4'-phosphopantetheinyl transferase superfamily protein [Hyphomonas sp.]|uniref:4'-phosphopantetheinyl transferase family protein n=1 Tax=Hyphomonas sp. TaxID=87 RepID=UPI003297E518